MSANGQLEGRVKVRSQLSQTCALSHASYDDVKFILSMHPTAASSRDLTNNFLVLLRRTSYHKFETAKMATPSAGWFNDAEYSDLTLKLSDGREVKVHKLVICKQNEYFRKLCGTASSFKVSSCASLLGVQAQMLTECDIGGHAERNNTQRRQCRCCRGGST